MSKRKSNHTDQGSWSWSKVLVLGWLHQVIFAKTGKYLKRNLDQTRHPGADGEAGDCGGRSLRCQSVPHHVWQPQGSLNRTPYNTTQWPTIISLLNLRSNLSSSSKVGLHPKQKNMKGRVAVRVCRHHITLNWPPTTPPTPGGRHPAHAWPQHRAGAHQDQGNQHGLVTIFWTIFRRARATRRLKWWSASPSSSWSTRLTS